MNYKRIYTRYIGKLQAKIKNIRNNKENDDIVPGLIYSINFLKNNYKRRSEKMPKETEQQKNYIYTYAIFSTKRRLWKMLSDDNFECSQGFREGLKYSMKVLLDTERGERQ